MATRFTLFAALTVLLACGTAASASAQNPLVNPNFDVSLSGWQPNSGGGLTVSWDGARDADGTPTSGSAKAVWTGPMVTGIYPVVSQCVEVTPGTPYFFGGKIFIPSGQTTPAALSSSRSRLGLRGARGRLRLQPSSRRRLSPLSAVGSRAPRRSFPSGPPS